MLFDGINLLLFPPLNIVHVQFAFPFVECHRIEECTWKPVIRVNTPCTVLTDLSWIVTEEVAIPKDKSVGTWNVDGEILRQQTLLLR